MKKLMLSALVVSVLTFSVAPKAIAGPGEHPQILDYYHFFEWDWDMRDYVYVLTVETVVDGFDEVRVDISLKSWWPFDGVYWADSDVLEEGVVDQDQVEIFQRYLASILSCDDADLTAHAYDHGSTHNSESPISIYELAADTGYLRYREFGCDDDLPPPLGLCDAEAAPSVSTLEPDSSSFFYVDIDLYNGNSLTLGFEYDGDQWDFSEQYGDAGECQGQLDKFVDYTMSILTSPSCAADTVYTPAEEEAIEWYVFEVENFCQDNL